MEENYVVLAIPVFFALMGIEFAVVRWRGKDYYRLGDAINSISCGIISQLFEAAIGLGPGLALYACARRLAPINLDPRAPSTWVFAILCVDFLYYWSHRYNHEINLLWAGHIVHHQSEEYNLSTALRQSWPTSVSAAFFYLPMAVAGIPFETYFAGVGLMLIYQFWIHTRLIGRLGPLEWVLNTPSHHRVHHGVNPEYVDRNYGGILIIWDRLFGTFAEERAPVIFGTIKPLSTWDPVRNNLDYWIELAKRSRRSAAQGLRSWLRPWLVSPAWTPEDPHPPLTLSEYRPPGYRKFEAGFSGPRIAYTLALFGLILIGTVVFLNFQDRVPFAGRLFFAIAISTGLARVSRPNSTQQLLTDLPRI